VSGNYPERLYKALMNFHGADCLGWRAACGADAGT